MSRNKPAPMGRHPLPPQLRPEKAGRVLLAEDDPHNRAYLRALLTDEEYAVIEAVDGEQALAAVRRARPDVILLDVLMPKVDGFAVCRRLKASPRTARLPILFITGLDTRDRRIEGIEAGAQDFLVKPVDPQDVLLRVRNAVQAKRMHDRLLAQYRQLSRLERLRDGLTHMLAHDMRTPLAAAAGYLDMLSEATDAPPPTSPSGVCLQRSRECVRKTLEMIQGMLDVSRLEAQRLPLQRSGCDVRECVRRGVEALGAPPAGVSLSVNLPEQPVAAEVDGEVVRRVVSNLVGNAYKFTPPGGRITVAVVLPRSGWAQVTVTDTGPGIAPQYHRRIFAKFGHVQAPGHARLPSTGLGLAFCKLAIEAHGGRIGIDSTPGTGSRFWFELPLASSRLTARTERARRRGGAVGERRLQAAGTAAGASRSRKPDRDPASRKGYAEAGGPATLGCRAARHDPVDGI